MTQSSAIAASEKVEILIVDDHPENLLALEGILAGLGLQLVRATSGNEALRLSLRRDLALVLMDVQMPEMDGYETAELMRGNPKTRNLPIIFVTAGMKEERQQFHGYDSGAVDYLVKPLDPAILRYKVRIFRDLFRERRDLELRENRLEERVALQTASLREEIARRQDKEEEIRILNAELERRVQQRTAELSAAIRELDSFAHSVSHDLRAPLRGINGWAQALHEDFAASLPSKAAGYIDSIRTEVGRMGQLIDALLALSHINRCDLRRELCDLSNMAGEITTRLRQSQPERQVTVIIPPGLATVGDPSLLRTMLQNLLDNAWKFTAHAKEPRIELGAISADERVIFFVCDNGAGFNMTYADRLFAPFQRLHAASDFPGTGVGLATVYRILQRHGGEIWVEATPDTGATFFFSLQKRVVA